MPYKTIHRKLKIEQREPQLKPGVNSGAPEGLAFLFRRVTIKGHEHHLTSEMLAWQIVL